MPLKIYKGTDSTGTLLTVSDIKIDLILDAKNVMTFIHDGTTALAKGDSLYCEYDDGASTQLPAFFGYIEEPPQSAVPPQEVMCMGMAGKMDWYIVAEGAAKTLQDKGIINQVNGGDASKLDLYDEEGNAIATTIPYTNLFTDHPVYYVIVSDATKQPSTVTCQNGANNYIGYGNSSTFEDNHGTDHTDVLMSYNAGTYFYGEHTQPTLGTVYYFADQFDFENYGIASTEELTYMRVTWSCTYSVLSTEVNFRNSVTPVLYIGSYELCRGPAIISLNGSTITGEWVSSWSGYIRDVATSIGFTQGDPNWKDGDIRIGLVQQPYNNPPTALALSKKFNMKLRWYALTVEVDHVSQTFDELNIAITDTEVGDTLGCDGTDFGDEGVTANDKWAVGISFNQAIANCFVPEAPIALPDYLYHVCHEGVIVDRGIVKDFFGCTGWEMLSQLVEEIEYHVWEDPVGRTIHIDDYAGMGDAIALNAPHPGSSAISEMPAVEYVYVIWKDGVVAKPTGTEGAKGIYKIQDEGILTEAEAWARATKYATKYANTSYAISLSYTGTPLVANGDLPYVGKRYSVNLYNSDGTTAAYTTQPARRVSISNNGGDEQYYTSVFLGMGSTPTWEKIPKEIMSLKKALSARQFKGMSSTYTPATRHSALNGVAGSTDQYHVSSSQYTNLLVHGDVDDVSVNGADDVPISSNWAYDHENNTTTAHGAVSTNTASKLVVRDANARAQFGDPAAAQDADVLLSTLYGYFPAAYNFKSDTVGNMPAIFTKLQADITASVIASKAGHSNVFYFDAVVDQFDEVYYEFTPQTSSQGFEFWLCLGQTTGTHGVLLNDNVTAAVIFLEIVGGDIKAYNNAALTTILSSYVANKWYHVRITWDVTADTFDVYIDGVLVADGYTSYSARNISSVYRFRIQNRAAGPNSDDIYIDAIDPSWSTGYFTNRNYPAFLAWLLGEL